MEMERKRELERRKKLRLLQVREQSKDFAHKLRENIQAGMIHEQNCLLELKKKELKEQQEYDLRLLNELYKTCLQNIGESHREAAKQPNINLIKQAESVQMSEKAAVRGAMARKQHFESEALNRQKIEAPIKQKRMIRDRENLRSFHVSSLPKHSTVPENHPLCEKLPNKHSEHRKDDKVLKEIPSNLLSSDSADFQFTDKTTITVTEKNLNKEFEDQSKKQKLNENSHCNKILEEDKFSNTASSKDCTCDLVCCCHDSPRELKRRCHSEPRVSSESNSELEEEIKKVKPRSRSCSPYSVRTLNYSDTRNLYESNQRSFARVTHHPTSSKTKKQDPFEYSVKYISPDKNLVDKGLKKKIEERSSKALQREKLKRDFEQLLRDLGNITREKFDIKSRRKSKVGVYLRERDILARNETKQRKLADAFEEVIHSVKPHQSQNIGSLSRTQQSEVDESSPSLLNLALYQQITMSSRGSSPQQPTMIRRTISTEQITISQTSIPRGDKSSQSSPRRTSPPAPRSRSPVSSKRSHASTPSVKRRRDQAESMQSPEVSVRTEPSGEVHLKVRLAKPLEHKKKCQRSHPLSTIDSSSSYYSPPENLSPSQKQLFDALLVQVNKKALNKDLKDYIKKLLAMSRESIDDLDVSSSFDRIDPVRSPTKKELQDDMVKLSELTDVYADKVNTLVDMFDQFERFESPDQFFTPPQFIDDGRSTSPQYEVPRVPPPSRLPTPIRQPTPPPHQPAQPALAASRSVPQQREPQRPGRRTPSPTQRVPRKPTTPPMQRRTRRPATPRPPLPQVRKVGPPPDSAESRIPMSPRYQSPERRVLSPAPQPQRRATPGPSGIQTPFGLSSNLIPHPQDVFGAPATQQSPTQSFGLSPIAERHEQSFPPSFSPPGQGSPQINEIFGDEFGNQDEWGDIGFGEEDFQDGADVILQTEAPEEGHVDYPEDFPPPTDVFGPGFDWETANLSDPDWPHSFPGEPLKGSQMADKDRIHIDTSFDADAMRLPLNTERINEVRRKLSKICNDQYREVIEMLKKDYADDHDEFGNLLKRVTSDPFQDPNATLAPIANVKHDRTPARYTPDTRSQFSTESSESGGTKYSPLNDRIDHMNPLSILARSLDKNSYQSN